MPVARSKITDAKIQSSVVILSLLLFACAHSRKAQVNSAEPDISANSVQFSTIAGDFITIPVLVENDIRGNFVFDTGIGINLISTKICQKIGCKVTGSFKGKRMSGQELTVPTTVVRSFTIGDRKLSAVTVGVFDTEAFFPGKNVDGFVSLDFFRKLPFTIDYRNHCVTFESSESLVKIKNEGKVAPIHSSAGPPADIFLPITLGGIQITVLVDSGSQILILDERFMKLLKINVASKSVERRDGMDETDHRFTRYFTELSTRASLVGHPEIGMADPKVMFQKIIYDGVIGFYFLRQFRVTYNLPESELIFRDR